MAAADVHVTLTESDRVRVVTGVDGHARVTFVTDSIAVHLVDLAPDRLISVLREAADAIEGGS